MTQRSSVLVTGGAGYIGSHTLLQLLARGERCRGARRSIHRIPPGGAGRRAGGRQRRRPCAGRPAAGRTPRRHHHPFRRAHHRAGIGVGPAQVLRQQHLLHALAAGRRGAGRREEFRVLFDRRGVRHPGQRPGLRGLRDRADQSLRHLEAHVGVDVARPVRRDRTCVTWRCATSTSPAPIRRAASASRRARPRCWSRWPARPPWASARSSPFSAPTTRPPTAPACATTSTSRTWPRRTSMRSTYLRDGGKSLIANCGYGHGYSVREVICERRKARRHPARRARRSRAAPAIRRRWWRAPNECATPCGWTPKLDDLDAIVRSSLEWERRLQREPWQ